MIKTTFHLYPNKAIATNRLLGEVGIELKETIGILRNSNGHYVILHTNTPIHISDYVTISSRNQIQLVSCRNSTVAEWIDTLDIQYNNEVITINSSNNKRNSSRRVHTTQ